MNDKALALLERVMVARTNGREYEAWIAVKNEYLDLLSHAGGWRRYPDEKPLNLWVEGEGYMTYPVLYRSYDGRLRRATAAWIYAQQNAPGEWSSYGHSGIEAHIAYWLPLPPLPQEDKR